MADIHLGKGFIVPAFTDSSLVLPSLKQAIQQGFKQGSTPQASDGGAGGKSRIAREPLS